MVHITYKINNNTPVEIADFNIEETNLYLKKTITPPDTSSSFDLELVISHNDVIKTRNFTKR